MPIQRSTVQPGERSVDWDRTIALLAFPVDISSFLSRSPIPPATACASQPGQLENPSPSEIALSALAHWNQYLETRDDHCREVFLTHARWFVEQEVRIGETSGGWPTSQPHTLVPTQGSWLSALAQGSALSVLARAYQITREDAFLEVAQRAVRSFEQDILDGGVCAPIGSDGIFFEEVAVYPAAHILGGAIFALLALYDYLALTGDARITTLIDRGLSTMHDMLPEYETGFWTYADLLQRRLATPAQLSQQAALLEALANYSGCKHCMTLASQWRSYQGRFRSRLRHLIDSLVAGCGHALLQRLRSAFNPEPYTAPPLRVCIPLNSLFVTGGILTVLRSIAAVTAQTWHIEFLTRHVGARQDEFVVHEFGTPLMAPWQFPTVWKYGWDGFWKLVSLMRRGAGYHIVMPQDGVFTGAFASAAAKLVGARVVCIDHANLTLLKGNIYRDERKKALALKKWPHSLLSGMLLIGYWPSLALLARIAARFTDHYLVPGIAGDGVEDICKELGIYQSRLTRFASMIDIERHFVLDDGSRWKVREAKGLADDAITVAIVCRLSTEKGLDIALEGVKQALSALPPDLGQRLRVIIAGDGPLRQSLEEDIRRSGLGQTCQLWGDISADDVLELLAISDVFLYTSTRGACFPMAVLEAMASGCAVIATTQPMSNAVLLAEGRGIAIPPGDAAQTAQALTRLACDLEVCRHMGRSARNYIATQHSATTFRRTLMRATTWSNLDELLAAQAQGESRLCMGGQVSHDIR